MNSFRVINARFRILKGGKIGLSLSIFLLGSMLTLSKTNALATDYFTGVQSTLGNVTTNTSGTISGAPEVTVQTATNSGLNTDTRSLNTYDAVVFNPTSWATSSYLTPTYTGNSGSNFDYTLNTSSSALSLTLTFASGSNAAGILKDTTTIYTTTTTGSVTINSDTSYNLTSSVSSNYTANLVFQGSNNVSGATNIGNGKITFTGGGSTFTGTVNAGSVDVNTTGSIRFNSDVDLSAGTTDELKFMQGGTVEFGRDFIGNITSGGVNNQGTVTFLGAVGGKAQTVTGNIGTSTSSDIGTLNVGSGASSYSTLTINGDIYSNSTVLNNNSTLILTNNSDLNSSTITTNANNTGTLTLNGSSVVSGNIGVSGTALKEINAGATGSTSTFSSDVYATNLDVEGTGIINLGGNYEGTSLRYNADGTVNVADGKNITASITTYANDKGTLTLSGSTTVSNQVGTNSEKLKEINAGANSSTSTFSSDVYATNLDVVGTGTVKLDGNYTGTSIRYNADGTVVVADNKDLNTSVTTNTNNSGTLSLSGSSTVTGQVGTNSNKLKEINAGASGETVVFESDVYATTTNVGAGEIKFESNLTGNIVSSADNQGIITFVGDGVGKAQTVTGNIGTSTSADIGTLNVGSGASSYSTLTINGDVYSNSTVLNNNSTLILTNNSDLNSSTITTSANNTGTLTLNGSSVVSGNIGVSGTALKEINAGATGSTSTFSGDVYATNLDVEGTGIVNLGGNYEGTSLRYNADGTVNVADGKNITASITTYANDKGTLTLSGSTTVSNQVGTNSEKLKEINAGANSSTSTFSSDVYATNLDVVGTGTVKLDGNYTGTSIRYNADGTVVVADNKDLNTSVTTNTNNSGTLSLSGSSTVTGQVGTNSNKLKEINAGASGETVVFESDVYATTTNVGAGEIKFESNLTGNIVSSADNQGIITFVGDGVGKAQTVTGNIGTSTSSDIGTLNVGNGGSSTYSTLTINGDVYSNSTVLNNNSTLILTNNSDLNSSTITTNAPNTGTLTLNGSSVVSGNIGVSGTALKEINAGATGSTSTFSGDVYATNVNVTSDGEVKFDSNLTGNIIATTSNQGTVTLAGSTNDVTGNVGNVNKLNVGTSSVTSVSTIDGDITATNIVLNNDSELILKKDGTNVTSAITTQTNNTGTLTVQKDGTIIGQVGASGTALNVINAGATASDVVVFESGVYATNTNITAGRVDFNKVSGTTTSNIIFNGTGEANLYGDLTGDINFAGYDATVNVKDGKGILGSANVLTSNNNTGILNYEGDGTIDGVIGALSLGIKELNVNTEDDQNKDGSGNVITQGLLANREIFADIINLRNNATLTLADNSNVTNTGTNNLVISTDNSGKGKVVFLGNSTVTGEIGTSSNNLSNITAGASGKTVTFNDMVYASTLTYSDNGTVVLNGHNSLDANKEGFIGTVDLGNTTGILEIGDGVNLTVDSSGIQFANANDATLRFVGDTTVYGILGGNEAGNSKFEEIHAGLNGKTATFKNDVYVEENTFHVGDGIVNFEGDLIGSLLFDLDGIVNMDNGKSVIVSSSSESIKTTTDNTGTVNFKGTTTLYGDLGTTTEKLKSVTFGSSGTSVNSYTQSVNKNVYAYDTYIGNGANNSNLNIGDDITFGGNLNVTSNSVLNVSNYDVTIDDNLNLASNSTTKFKVYTTDISAGQAVTNANSGSITTDSLTVASDSKIHIDYQGSWYGAGTYDLITANTLTGTFDGTEANGLVSDNSIIDSIVKVNGNGNNLTLYADRTGGGSYDAEDLYIVKSDIGKDYSNNASKALANYANEEERAGALADIINKLEDLEDGVTVSQAKKDEMIRIQRKLTPIANSSNVQTTLTSTNLATTTIGSRLSDIRRTETNNFTPNIYSGNYAGLSSGDYGYDTSFWVKGMGSKATQDNVKDYYGYDTTTYGFVAGMDKTMHDGTIFGIALGYSDTKTNQDNADADTSNTNSVQATIYSSKEIGNSYVDGYLSYSKHTTDGTRTANSGKLSSSVDTDQISAKVEAGHKIMLNDGVSLTPFASLEYSLLNQKGYTEKGSAYQNDALKVDSLKLKRGTVELGAKVISNIELEDTLIIPQFSTSIYNTFGDDKADIKAQYVGGGEKFVTPVQDLNKTMINVGFGVETKISDSTSLIFDIEHDRSRDGSFEAYSGSVTFGVSF